MAVAGVGALFRGLLRITLAAAAFIGIFAATAGGAGLVLAAWLQTDLLDPRTIYLGLICGLIAWLFAAVFLLRKETLHLPFAQRKVFLQRIKAVLGELGYDAIFETEDHARFRPRFSAMVMGGGILVKTHDNTGTITGPRVSLERLRRRLRLFQQLAHVQQSVSEPRRKAADGLLKRVQVTLRLPPTQWPEVLDHLIAVLGHEDTLVFELHVLAQSVAGIRETIVEERLRDWFHARGIAAEIRKEHALLGEPTPANSALPAVPAAPAAPAVPAAPAENRLGVPV